MRSLPLTAVGFSLCGSCRFTSANSEPIKHAPGNALWNSESEVLAAPGRSGAANTYNAGLVDEHLSNGRGVELVSLGQFFRREFGFV